MLQCSKITSSRVIIITLFFTILFFLAPDNKFVFLISFLHLATLVIFLKNVIKSFLFAYLPWYVFDHGRVFEAILVPIEVIQSPSYSSPVTSVFQLSPFFILSVLMFFCLFMIKNIHFTRLKSKSIIGVLLVLFFYCIVRSISAILTEYNEFFSFMYVFKELSILFWMILIWSELNISKDNAKFILGNILAIIGILFSIEAMLAVGQLFAGGYFGLHVERAHYISQFGLGADENASLLRVSGFWSHPNELADWLVRLTTAGFLLIHTLTNEITGKKFDKILVIFLIVLSIISAITLNRVTIITLTFTVFLYKNQVALAILNFESRIKTLLKSFFGKITVIFIITATFFVSLRIGQRLYLTLFSLNEYGGFTTRLSQYEEAFELLFKKPIFGAGPDMFTAALYQWMPNGEILFFPEKVHNGFLLIATESGVLAFLLVIFLFVFMLKSAVETKYKNIAYIIIFHTFSNMMLHRVDSHFLTISGVLLILALIYEKNLLVKS